MQAIRTRYHGPTNYKGSRISAKCEARTIYLSYDHALNGDENHRKAAKQLAQLMNWPGTYFGGEFQRDTYWIMLPERMPEITPSFSVTRKVGR